MKHLKFLLLLAFIPLALASCEKDDEEKTHGEVTYDGKTYEINDHVYKDMYFPNDDLSSPDGSGNNLTRIQTFILACIPKKSDAICQIRVPFWDNAFAYTEIELDGEESKATFWCEGKGYTHGLAYFGSREEHLRITGGYFKWKPGKKTGRLDFSMKFEDGLTAEGYANIPMSIF